MSIVKNKPQKCRPRKYKNEKKNHLTPLEELEGWADETMNQTPTEKLEDWADEAINKGTIK